MLSIISASFVAQSQTLWYLGLWMYPSRNSRIRKAALGYLKALGHKAVKAAAGDAQPMP